MSLEIVSEILIKNSLLTAFAFVGLLVFLSYRLSDLLSKGRLHGSAIAITIGLVLAYPSSNTIIMEFFTKIIFIKNRLTIVNITNACRNRC